MRDQLTHLRNEMTKNNIDIYYIPSNDFHGSEYVGEHFQARRYVSGFTGSAGTLIVTKTSAYLWTDGRYFTQAEYELEGSGITLMRMGEKDVLSLEDWLKENLRKDIILGLDGRCLSASDGFEYENIVNTTGANLIYNLDLVDTIWKNRPDMSNEPVWILDERYSGVSTTEKMNTIRKDLKDLGDNNSALLLCGLDDIAWTLNLRGNDISYCPIFLSYLLIMDNRCVLYADCEDKSKFNAKVRSYLSDNGIELKSYNSIYEDMLNLTCDIYTDYSTTNYTLVRLAKQNPNKINITNITSPVSILKAVKNPTECNNIKNAHIKDGVALVKFMKWLKESNPRKLTEISVAKKLEQFRMEQEGYIEPSFEPIMGYKEHGAIIHYSATDERNSTLCDEGFLLSDTGAHYLEGTTDVTRTFVLGELTEEMKYHYTLVLKGHLGLLSAVFKEGCSGLNLDYIARKPIWDAGLDYNHGTGHGVGYLLNVHEGPQAIRHKKTPRRSEDTPFSPGMITSNEPGLYFPGKYGIRLENLVLCIEKNKNENGRFLCFQPLTLCPFEKDAIILSQLTKEEIKALNDYHSTVYDHLEKYLSEEEKLWLKCVTTPLQVN